MRRLTLFALVGSAGCGPALAPELTISTAQSTFDGRTQRAIVEFSAIDEHGAEGSGTISVFAPVGELVEGATVTLVSGRGSVTYRCNPLEDAACAGPIRLGASWRGVDRSLIVRVTPSDPSAKPLWRAVPTLQPVTLYAAAMAPDHTIWAVGERGVVLPYVPSTGWGTPVATQLTSTLRALLVSDDGQLTIAGDDGVLLQGAPGSLAPLTHSMGRPSFTALARHQGRLYAATATGEVCLYDVNDLVPVAVTPQPLNSLASLSSKLIAAGDDGLFESSDGEHWSSMAAPVLARWMATHVDADGLWALGRRSTGAGDAILVRGPGPDWRSTSLPTGEVEAMAWGIGTADRYVATKTSVFRQQLGAEWQDLEAPAGGKAIVVISGLSVLVVGPPGISLLRVR